MLNKKTLLSGAAALAIAAPYGASAQDTNEKKERFTTTDEIVVTASPLERSVGETIIGTSVVKDEDLSRRVANSIGETLRREPGVSSTYFGPGASRPVIRGLGGDRIRVLDAGIGSIDASAASPDHAPAVDAATAKRIEIVRGAATLLYGSSAAGGVVNVFNGRIPEEEPEGGVDGILRIGRSTVDDGVETAGGFDVKLGDIGDGALVFHGDGFYREADDYDIPGFAESARQRALEEAEEEDHDHEDEDEDHDHEHEEEEVFGTAENSAYETKGGSAGLSWVFDNGFFGISGTAIDTTYGVPGGHEHAHEHEDEDEEDEDHDEEEHDHEEEGGVTVDLRQRRLDLNGEVAADFGLFEKAKIRVGYADYEHKEIEASGEIGTVFSNEGWEGRLEFVDKKFAALGGEFSGAAGFQYRHRNFSALGEEAFVPPTQTDQYGVFMLKEYAAGPWRLELGGRYENTSHEVETTGEERNFDAFSVSGGVGFTPADPWFFGVTGFRTERAPSTEELFSDGAHLATAQYELGDSSLGEEVGRGVEGTARYSTDVFTLSLNGFYTSYKDFIYEMETGLEEDGLGVFQFTAADATFRGFEAYTEAEFFHAGAFDIHGDASVDYVRATIDDAANENLPRIPPLKGLIGLEARSELIDLRGEFEFAAKQDKTAEFELPTDGYQVVNAYLTLKPFTTQRVAFRVSGENLTDEEVRLHTSFLKDKVPLPGRNVKFSIEGRF